MSNELPDTLIFEGREYGTITFPLEALLQTVGTIFEPSLPGHYRGYWATWVVECGQLYLTDLRSGTGPYSQTFESLRPRLFPEATGPVRAHWYTGIIRGTAGHLRHLGVPPRRIYDKELILQVEAGRVTADSLVDNSALPDPTDDEIRQTIPRFLWPERMRNEK